MVQEKEVTIASRAKQNYEDRLESVLEPTKTNQFVAIEPESGDHFLGDTFSEAIGESRKKHPRRLVYAIRVGHAAAIHFGMHVP